MKVQSLAVLACAASLFAQTADAPAAQAAPAAAAPASEQILCREAFDAVKNTYPRDAAADRIYASVEARVRTLEAIKKDDRKGQQYATELNSCVLAVNLFKIQLDKAALQKSLDSIIQKNIAAQKELSQVKDSLIELWTSDAQWAKSLNSALNDEHARLERLSKETAARDSAEKARLAKELEDKRIALAEKDSLLAKQKAEAEKKLDALRSQAISIYKDARGTILSMSDILFETNKADLKPELKENLAEISAILKSLLTESHIVIEGHTDDAGSAEHNKKLSEQRAGAVLNYLAERGVEKTRMESVGYGLTKPIASNKTADGKPNPEGMAKNRRVEIVIKD